MTRRRFGRVVDGVRSSSGRHDRTAVASSRSISSRRRLILLIASSSLLVSFASAAAAPRRVDQERRELLENFYESAARATADERTTSIETVFLASQDDEEYADDPPPRVDPYEYEEEKKSHSIHSTLLQVNADSIFGDDLAAERSIGISLLTELDNGGGGGGGDATTATATNSLFVAKPGPSELAAEMDPEDHDESPHRSHEFWYGEQRDDVDNDNNGNGRRRRRRLNGNGNDDGNSKFVPSMSLLRKKSGNHDTTHEFISASITTADRVVDVTTLPNGTVVMEVTKWEDFPDIDDDEPPVHLEAEYEDEEDGRRRERLLSSGTDRRPPSSLPQRILQNTRNVVARRDLLAPSSSATTSTPYPVIDIMVVYTKRAMCAQAKRKMVDCDGSDPNVRAPIEARIELAVQETNTGYLLSEVRARARLRHVEYEPDYDDDRSFSMILGEFAGRNDGRMDRLHDVRAKVGADLVVLIVENAQYCGLGYMYNGFRAFGFSVSSRKCMTGYYSFGHEVAHNMGCNHNRETSVHKEPFAHGYQSPGNEFRTIMSYNCPRGCPRINRYSNPNLKYGGLNTGSAKEDNARQINAVAERISKFYREVEIEGKSNGSTTDRNRSNNNSAGGNGASTDPACEIPVDPFKIRLLFDSDEKQIDNDWFGTVDRRDPVHDQRLSFANPKHAASYDSMMVQDRTKTNQDDDDDANAASFKGQIRLSVSKSPLSTGFEDLEMTAYVKWTSGKDRYVTEPSVILYLRSDSAADDVEGCNGQSYMASLSKKTGAVRFMKQYYRNRSNMVTSHQLMRTLPNFARGVPTSKWVGIKFVVYNTVDDDQDAVKLELYIDDTDGKDGGDWQKVMELTDKDRYWNAYRSWHYHYFLQSKCRNTDGKLVKGKKKYSILESLGDPSNQFSLKNISVRNILSEESRLNSKCTRFSLKNQYSKRNDANKEERSSAPTPKPSPAPIPKPSPAPTPKPSPAPTPKPSPTPTAKPSPLKSQEPTAERSLKPSSDHSSKPTSDRSIGPSSDHSSKPTSDHSFGPSSDHSIGPSASISSAPSAIASAAPSSEPIECDAFGLNTMFESDLDSSDNDWSLDDGPNPVDDDERVSNVGSVDAVGEGRIVLLNQASLYVKRKENPASASSEGFRNIEFTGYGNYRKEGISYQNSGLTMAARADHTSMDQCQASLYLATIQRSTGDAVFRKLYWEQQWKSVFAVPQSVAIPEFEGGLPADTWIGMKLIVHDLDGDRVRLRLLVDLTKGENGGDWKIVHEFVDGPGVWKVDDRNPYRQDFMESPCGDKDGEAFLGPSTYCAITNEGMRGTEVHWKNVSVRNVSFSETINDGENVKCDHKWKD